MLTFQAESTPQKRPSPNARRSSGGGLSEKPPSSPYSYPQQVAAALSAAVTTTPSIGDAPTSQAELSRQKRATRTPAALRERGVWGERRFSQRSGLSHQSSSLPSSCIRFGKGGEGMREETGQQPNYGMVLEKRAKAMLTGVTEVESFDDGQVVLSTHGGRLVITGAGLHVSSLVLEEGKLSLEGTIDGMHYEGGAQKRGGFLRRALR